MDNVIAFDPQRRSRRRRAATPAPARGIPVAQLAESWINSLGDRMDLSEHTIRNYSQTARYFTAWLDDNGHEVDSETLDPIHIRRYLQAEIERTSRASAAGRHQHLKTWWRWVEKQGEREAANPMTDVECPKVPQKVRSFYTEQQQRDLLATCTGNDFRDRRDTAILRIFQDTGMRISGMVGLRYHRADESLSDVDLRGRRLRIRLKGGAEHWVPLGRKAVAALDRYLLARARQPIAADSPWLWISLTAGGEGRLGQSGVRQMVYKRGAAAGIQDAHPHRFRRSFAHAYLDGGGDTDGLMAIAGWRSYRMPLKYAGELAAERARKAHVRLSPSDRI